MNSTHIYKITRKGQSYSCYIRVFAATGEGDADATIQDYIRTNLPSRPWNYDVQVLLAYDGVMDSLRAISNDKV